jgi:transposase-like protein
MAHLQERKLRVAKRRYTKEFREFAVEQLRGCENIVALARELQVSRGNFTGGATNWIPRYPGWKQPGKRHAPPRCAKR